MDEGVIRPHKFAQLKWRNMKTTTVTCEQCGSPVIKPTKEVTRSIKLGRKFYCNNSCHLSNRNSVPRFDKTCPQCGTVFPSSAKVRASTFCSRGCASAGSVTELRRESARRTGHLTKANLVGPVEALKAREAWKYEQLAPLLQNTAHEFEHKIGDYVFDLVLFDYRVIVEFDGPDHRGREQRMTDQNKDSVALAHGYTMVRKPVGKACGIPSDTIVDLVS